MRTRYAKAVRDLDHVADRDYDLYHRGRRRCRTAGVTVDRKRRGCRAKGFCHRNLSDKGLRHGALSDGGCSAAEDREEALMADRSESPAYRMLNPATMRVLNAIEAAIGNGSAASVSYTTLMLEFHIGRQSISKGLKLLDRLGLIDIEPGLRLVNVFRLSNRWRTIDEVEAVRLAALAREVLPHRRFEKWREPKPVKPPKPPKPMVARPRVMQRRVPSLPVMPWRDDGGFW
jgi:hypothetical protein